MEILVLGLGNELLSDDAVGILAARRLKSELAEESDETDTADVIRVVETSVSGAALLDYLVGCDRAVIIDAVQTGARPAGSIEELTPADLGSVIAPSPHYAGLPEVLALARQLRLHFPTEIRIFAIEARDLYTIGGALCEPVEKALPELLRRIRALVGCWKKERTAHA
jgi:hydrogenase maturation protease